MFFAIMRAGNNQGGKMDADILGDLNQDYDLEKWETGDEEKERKQLEELFGPQ